MPGCGRRFSRRRKSLSDVRQPPASRWPVRDRTLAGPRSADRVRLNRAAVVLAVSAVVGVLASCTASPAGPRSSGSGGTPVGSATTATSSPADDAATRAAVARDAVEDGYRAFWPVVATFALRPEPQWRAALSRVAADPQLSFALAVARQHRRDGIAVYGQVRPLTPTVALDRTVMRATVRDCADFSRTGQVDVLTHAPRTVGAARTPLSASVSRGADGRWRVSQVMFPGGRC